MPNFKMLTTISISAVATAAVFSGPAFAQDMNRVVEPVEDPIVADFTAADLDQDASLNADEFVTFAVMRAEDGDEAFKDVVLSGEYDTKFAAHDKDASGGVSADELGHAEKSDMMKKEGDAADAESDGEPELN